VRTAERFGFGGCAFELGARQPFTVGRADKPAQPQAIANAVKVAAKAARDGLVPALKAALAEL